MYTHLNYLIEPFLKWMDSTSISRHFSFWGNFCDILFPYMYTIYKWKHPGNAPNTKHSPPEAPKEDKMRNK